MKDIKKSIKKYQFTKILLFVVIVSLCGYILYDRIFVEEDYQQAISHSKIEKIKKNEVVISMLPPRSMSPIVSTSKDVQYLGRLIYSRLFTFNEKMAPIPDLVDDFSVNGRQLNITLKDAKWNKSGNVLADDVIFSMEAIKEYGEKGPYYEKVKKIENITGTGKYLTVTFNDPHDISFAYLSFPIVSKETYSQEIEGENRSIPQGSGMYKVEEYDYGKQIKCIPNTDFYGTKAKSRLLVKMYKKSSEFDTLVETSNISVLPLDDAATEGEITKDDIKIKSYPGNSVDFIGFNFRNSFCKNGYLRLALAHAIDINDIRKDSYYDSLRKTDSFFVPGYLGAKKIKDYDVDLERAVKYLEKANIKDLDGDGTREYSNRDKMSLNILVSKDKKERVYAAEEIVENFEDIGIKANVVAASKDEYLARLRSGNFDLYIGGLNVDETMDFRMLLGTDGSMNYTGFSESALDYQMDLFMSGNDNEKNKVCVEEIKKLLHKKIPYYVIGYHKFSIVRSKALEGELKPNFVSPYRGIETWSCIYDKIIIEEEKEDEESSSDK